MWFCYRYGLGTSYRIGYAIKKFNEENWFLKLTELGIAISQSSWYDNMISYPCIFQYKNKTYMVYNGNDYGKIGIGLAVLENFNI
tara:strand:+ start:446 stop:700 length:255 start_codon:yes stop_codon:yes gene_type:complete